MKLPNTQLLLLRLASESYLMNKNCSTRSKHFVTPPKEMFKRKNPRRWYSLATPIFSLGSNRSAFLKISNSTANELLLL